MQSRRPHVTKNKRNVSRLKKTNTNQIQAPDLQSITSTNSDTSHQTSIEMEVFLARSGKKQIDHTSDDVTDLSESTTSPTSSKQRDEEESDQISTDINKSYRDKLKERFRNVKQKSTRNLEKLSLKKFKTTSQHVISLNKCIESLRQENIVVDQQLKSHKAYEYVGSDNAEVSSAEKYQFFCESLSEKWQNEGEEIQKISEAVDEERQVGLIVSKRSEPVKELLNESYQEMIWKPLNKTLIFEAEKALRNLDNEGLFVPQPPKLTPRQLYQLEQRLLAADNRDWFDSSGRIQFEASNNSWKSYRPDGFAEVASFEVFYQKALLGPPALLSSIAIKKPQVLDINIRSIRFSKHPLFSQEHALQENLIRHFDRHKDFQRHNKRDKLFKRLQALRTTKRGLNAVENASGDGPKLQGYALLQQIQSIREELYKECKEYRENAKEILTAWKDLKKMREDKNYATTSIRLVINKNKSKTIVDNIEETLEEVSQLNDIDYQKSLLHYKKQLAQWKRNMESEDAIEEERPMKPPRVASAQKVRSRIEKNFEESFGSENEPAVSFTVTYSNDITKLAELNDDEEKTRRNAVNNSKISIKLFCNDIEVCRSKARTLSDNFTLHFDDYLTIKLETTSLDFVQVQLCQQQSFAKKILCTVNVPVPKRKQSQGQGQYEEITFENHEEIAGFLTYSIGWSNNDEKIPSDERNKSQNLILNKDGTLNVDELNDWIEANNPDPEDPRNEIMFDYLHEQQSPSADKPRSKYFRCDPFLEPFTICTKDYIEENVRLQLLHLRDRNEPEFVGMIVPNRLKEIPSNIFATYKRRIAEERYQEYFDEEDTVDDDIVMKRSLGRKYLRQIHTKIFQICRNCENNLCFEDVVNEKMMPWIQNYLRTLIANLLNWFRLKPTLSTPLPIFSPQEHQMEVEHGGVIRANDAKLIIYLKGAKRLPIPHAKSSSVSSESRKMSGKSRASTDSSKTVQFGKYFVEITYNNEAVASSLVAGKNAQWNEQLSFQLESTNLDYMNPNSLSGLIYVNLFQQVEDEKITSDTTWLGRLEIPISATMTENKLEGFFQMKIPPYIFGYENKQDTQSAQTPRSQQQQLTKSLCFLEMSIHSEQIIPKISADLESIASSEPPFLRDHILEWNKRFNEAHAKRKFSALAITTSGKTACLTRFVKPLEPPQLNSGGFDVTSEQCARYVSLIPFTSSNKFYQNVWLTAEQMLKLGIGSVMDHAVLLTCYLLSLNLEVWLVIGFGIPNGLSAYVLEREYVNETTIPNHYVIDVTTTLRYNVVTDSHCPLQKVFCAVNKTNIWGNVQRGDSISTTRFDFTRRFDWQPLFNNQIPSPSNSLQQKLHYLNSGNALSVQNAIEKKLRKKIAKARPQEVTIWNHYVSSMLKAQISKAEANFMHNKTQILLPNEFHEITKNLKMNGFIEFLPFSSVNDVVEYVFRTKTWDEITSAGVEFATSVQVQAYANQVISVWIAFVAIVKK